MDHWTSDTHLQKLPLNLWKKILSPQTYCRMCLLPFFGKKCKKIFHFLLDKDMLGPWGYWGPCPDPQGLPHRTPRLHFSPAWGRHPPFDNAVAVPVFGPMAVSSWWGLAAGTQPWLIALQKHQGCWWTPLLVPRSARCAQALQDAGSQGGHGQPWGPLGAQVPQLEGAAGSHCSLTRHEDEFWWKWYVSFIRNPYYASHALCAVWGIIIQWEF